MGDTYLQALLMEPGWDLVPVGTEIGSEDMYFGPFSHAWQRRIPRPVLADGLIVRRRCKHTNSCPLCPRRS